MKRLTINRIAGAGLQRNKKAYMSLAIGVFLSIFLISVLCLSVWGMLLAERQKIAERMGAQDCMLLDSAVTDSALMEEGTFGRIGHVYLRARAEETDFWLGYYDETAAELLMRKLEEGRMPEKPGEIALERSALESMRMEASVGDTIELTAAPEGGRTEKKIFTVTGILKEQTQYLFVPEWERAEGRITAFPAAVIHPDESFSDGRTVLHRLMTLKGGVGLNSVLNAWLNRGENFFGIGIAGEVQKYAYSSLFMDDEVWLTIVMALILGASLIIAAGIGVSQAMEGRVMSRIEQIGMLRAVGATRRQIRKIFGREAWLLALILSPVSVSAACACVFLLSVMAPDVIRFGADIRLIGPIAVLSVTSILLSSGIPLRNAAKTMPMSVIRDVGLIRKAKGIRGKKRFSVPRLIAARQMRLHPGRQIGSAFLVAVTLFMAGAATYLYNGVTYYMDADSEAFYLRVDSRSRLGQYAYVQTMPRRILSEQDLEQISRMEHVSRVAAGRELRVNLVMDEIPEYIIRCEEEGVFFELSNRHLTKEASEKSIARHEQVKRYFSLDGELADVFLYIVDDETLSGLRENLASGSIDKEAIDAGREMLIWTPDVYIIHFGEGSSSFSNQPRPEYGEPDVVVTGGIEAGTELHIAQMFRLEGENESRSDDIPYEEVLAAAEKREAFVTVGGMLKGNISDAPLFWPNEMCLITTDEGARKLGLYTETMESAAVFLDGEIDRETEESLEKQIGIVAMRGERVEVENRLAQWRKSRQESWQMIAVFVCVALVFFSVSLSIITGSVRRRIRSDVRMLGMLRSVGADKKCVTGCYSGQVLAVVLTGLAAAAALYSACYALSTSGYIVYTGVPLWATLTIMAGMASLMYALCRAGMKMSIRSVMSRSVVENIREL